MTHDAPRPACSDSFLSVGTAVLRRASRAPSAIEPVSARNLDLDSDGDGARDVAEAGLVAFDTNGDGRVDGAADLDGDGLRDAADANTAQAGFPSAVLPDVDSDTIPSPYDVAESVGGSGDSDGTSPKRTAEPVFEVRQSNNLRSRTRANARPSTVQAAALTPRR
ncbi:MAG: hypothetical protein ACM3ZE_24935 [Myxococcales bacterium]